MNVLELGTVIVAFFEEGRGPSHDELDRAFVQTGLAAGDPAPGGTDPWGKSVGKMKRLRSVFDHATQHDTEAGLRLARRIVVILQGGGAFNASLPAFAGVEKIERLRSSFDRAGFVLRPDGDLRAKVIDNLEGTERTEWLQAYVDRLNANPDDVPLQIGTGKELDEATARHVIEQKAGDYKVSGRGSDFPFTLSQAFYLVGFAGPPTATLDPDPHRAVQQCLFLLAKEVNRLRNDAGTGHGRPSGPKRTSPLTPAEARLVARATALVAGALLDKL